MVIEDMTNTNEDTARAHQMDEDHPVTFHKATGMPPPHNGDQPPTHTMDIDTTKDPTSTSSDMDVEGSGGGGGRLIRLDALARAFILDSHSEWMTVATGVAGLEVSPDATIMTLTLNDESNPDSILFSTTFHGGDEAAASEKCTRQQATVVTWTTADGSDVALSFETAQSCDEFWIHLCKFLDKNPEYTATSFEGESEGDGEGEEMDSSHDGLHMSETELTDSMERIARSSGEASLQSGLVPLTITLPNEVTLETLDELEIGLKRAVDAPLGDAKRQLANVIVNRGYIARVIEVFHLAEDIKSLAVLHKIFSIVKSLLALGNASIFRELLSEQWIVSVAGIFEYDPSAEEPLTYRQYLLDESRFKRVFDFGDGKLLEAIHHSFRAQFMKDVVLPKYLDEEAYASIVFMLRCSFAEIVEGLENDPSFLPQLLSSLSGDVSDDLVPIDLLKLVKEYLALAKTSASGRQLSIYRPEALSALITFLRDLLRRPCHELWSDAHFLASEIILSIIQYDVNILRTHTLERRSTLPMSDQLLCAIIDKCNDMECPIPLRWQLVAILRNLLDNSSPLGAVLAISNDDFLNFFYPDYALRLLSPLTNFNNVSQSSSGGNGNGNGDGDGCHRGENGQRMMLPPLLSTSRTITQKVKLSGPQSDLLYNTCELLTTFIVQHKYRIKYLLFKSFIIHNALSLLHCQDKALRLCALRVIRTMLGTQDDFYFRFLIKQSLFKTIIEEAISIPATTDNALTSAIIDLFLLVRDRKYKLVLNHLMESYRRDLDRIAFYPIGKMLAAVYDQSTRPLGYAMEDTAAIKGDRWSSIDRSEEAYFSNLEDEDQDQDQDVMNDRASTSTPSSSSSMTTEPPPANESDSEEEFVSRATDAEEYDTRPTPSTDVDHDHDRDVDDADGDLSKRSRV